MFLRNKQKQIWVFGAIQKDIDNRFIKTVQKRDEDTLLPLVKKFILSGTKIITDGWKAYNNLEQERIHSWHCQSFYRIYQ